jgi:hypothetical protein
MTFKSSVQSFIFISMICVGSGCSDSQPQASASAANPAPAPGGQVVTPPAVKSNEPAKQDDGIVLKDVAPSSAVLVVKTSLAELVNANDLFLAQGRITKIEDLKNLESTVTRCSVRTKLKPSTQAKEQLVAGKNLQIKEFKATQGEGANSDKKNISIVAAGDVMMLSCQKDSSAEITRDDVMNAVEGYLELVIE